MSDDIVVSPSRRYVVMCSTFLHDNYYFRWFELPEGITNTSKAASWYYSNHLDRFTDVEKCFSLENFINFRKALNWMDIIKTLYESDSELEEPTHVREILGRDGEGIQQDSTGDRREGEKYSEGTTSEQDTKKQGE